MQLTPTSRHVINTLEPVQNRMFWKSDGSLQTVFMDRFELVSNNSAYYRVVSEESHVWLGR